MELPSSLTHEEKQRFRKLISSEDFRKLFVEKVVVPRILAATQKLDALTNDVRMDYHLKGQRFALTTLVSGLCATAGISNIYSPRLDVPISTDNVSDEIAEGEDEFDESGPDERRHYNSFIAE